MSNSSPCPAPDDKAEFNDRQCAMRPEGAEQTTRTSSRTITRRSSVEAKHHIRHENRSLGRSSSCSSSFAASRRRNAGRSRFDLDAEPVPQIPAIFLTSSHPTNTNTAAITANTPDTIKTRASARALAPSASDISRRRKSLPLYIHDAPAHPTKMLRTDTEPDLFIEIGNEPLRDYNLPFAENLSRHRHRRSLSRSSELAARASLPLDTMPRPRTSAGNTHPTRPSPRPPVSKRASSSLSESDRDSVNSVWDELEALKVRIRHMESNQKAPPTATSRGSSDRPRTATTAPTTIDSSPRRIQKEPEPPKPQPLHPLLHDALRKAQPLLNAALYRTLEASAKDALALAAMTSTSERQLRRTADNMCRNLTDLCLALSEGKLETPSSTNISPRGSDIRATSNVRPGSRLEMRRTSILGGAPSVSPRGSDIRATSNVRPGSRLETRRTSLLRASTASEVSQNGSDDEEIYKRLQNKVLPEPFQEDSRRTASRLHTENFEEASWRLQSKVHREPPKEDSRRTASRLHTENFEEASWRPQSKVHREPPKEDSNRPRSIVHTGTPEEGSWRLAHVIRSEPVDEDSKRPRSMIQTETLAEEMITEDITIRAGDFRRRNRLSHQRQGQQQGRSVVE